MEERGLILRYYLRICLEGLKKTTKNLSQDLKWGPSKYEAEEPSSYCHLRSRVRGFKLGR
jgi:hypothetical protein